VFKAGVTGGTQGNVEVQGGFSAGFTVGHAFEVKKETTNTIGLSSQRDLVDHETDVFLLWVNPQVHIEQTSQTAWSMSITPGSDETTGVKEKMKIVWLTVAELRDPTKIAAFKRPDLANMKPSDYASILKLDVLATVGAKPDPRRYQLESSLQLEGPDQKDDTIPIKSREISNEVSDGGILGFVAETTASVTFGTKFSFFGLLEVGIWAGVVLEWDVESNTTSTTGTLQSAKATLITSTVEHHEVFDIYYDRIFHSFAFVSQNGPVTSKSVALSGVITKAGKPVANQPVTITLPDRLKRRVTTNARGKYRVFNLAPGTHEVHVEDQTRSVAVPADHPTELNIELEAK
jgi:hypothetical protein